MCTGVRVHVCVGMLVRLCAGMHARVCVLTLMHMRAGVHACTCGHDKRAWSRVRMHTNHCMCMCAYRTYQRAHIKCAQRSERVRETSTTPETHTCKIHANVCSHRDKRPMAAQSLPKPHRSPTQSQTNPHPTHTQPTPRISGSMQSCRILGGVAEAYHLLLSRLCLIPSDLLQLRSFGCSFDKG